MTDVASDRRDKMNFVVFKKENIEEIRSVINSVLEVFMTILDRPFEHGNFFTYKDILDRMMKVDQNVWRDINSKYLKDPFHDYDRGDFTASENADPAKILLDIIKLLSGAETSLYQRLQEYESVFRTLKDEKRSITDQLNESEAKLMEEIQSHSIEHIELKKAQGKLEYYESLLAEKNDKISELQRYNTIELWEREKKKVLLESNAKLVEATEELAEVNRINRSHTKKLQMLEEQNRVMKMKQELAEKPSGIAASQALEDMKRKYFLLEKDVMCLEQELNNLQKVYIAVLGGIRTDLQIASEKYRSPETNELTDVDLEQLDNRITYVYEKARNAELEKRKSELLPHYQYIPQDVKVKKIRRISISSPNIEHEQDNTDMKNQMGSSRRRHFMHGAKATQAAVTVQKLPSTAEKKLIENPNLLDATGNFLNWDACHKHFPHLTKDLVRSQWQQFTEYDNNGDRSLDFSEVVAALSGMGMQFTASQAEEAMREVDVNRSQTLDFYEYLLIADKITRQTGRSQLFKSGTVKTHSNVIAKTCVIQ